MRSAWPLGWAWHWRMESYLIDEPLPQVGAQAPVQGDRGASFGHSMGGHGALTLALRHPGVFKRLPAIAPICAPMACAWGQKAIGGCLGEERSAWAAHDASALMGKQHAAPYPQGILIDQGLADKFLAERQLQPEAFETACRAVGQPLQLRRHVDYDHGYDFIASVIEAHLRHHAMQLAQ